MRNLANLFYRKPRLTALTIGTVLVSGLSAFTVLPRAEDPTLARRFALITTPYPGANAERVEALVTDKLEDALQEVEDLKLIESVSRTGISVLTLETDDHIDDMEAVWSRVRGELDTVEPQLPAGAGDPELERQTVTAFTLITALVWDQPDPPQYAILSRMGEDLADELRGVSGTAEVELYGDPDEEIRVEVDGADLALLDLSLGDVAAAIRQADAKAPAGLLHHRETDLVVEVAGEVESLSRVLEIPVRVGVGGQAVRVGDVARVQKTVRDPPSELARIGGKPAVVVAARIEDNQRVDWWAEQARERVARFAERVPAGLQLDVIFDQSKYVEARLDGLTRNLLIAMGLVLIVIHFMMGWRSAIAVGVALPLSSMMVLAGMRVLGIPLHQMSVTGLIVALGLLIDNAIVVVDEVRRRRDAGGTAADAVAGAVRHLAVPLFGSTFTTALAFMPIVLMPGAAGEFVGSIAVSVILAIVSSLFLSLTVIPALTGLFDRAASARKSGSFWGGLQWPGLTRGYRRVVEVLVGRPVLGVVVALVLPVLGFWKAASLDEQFFPPADRDQFQIELHLPAHASIDNTLVTAEATRDLLRAHPEVVDVHWFLGTNAPKFYYNMFGTNADSSFYAQALVQLRDGADYFTVIRQVQDELDAGLPQAQLIARQLEQGPPFEAPVEIKLFGPDLDVLREIGEQLRADLAALPDTVHTRATLGDGRPKLWFRLAEEEARLAQLDNVQIADHVRANLSGVTGGSLLEATEELPVRVRLEPGRRGNVEDIQGIELVSRAAQADRRSQAHLPLAALGGFELTPELSYIPHKDGLRVNTVQGFIDAGVLPSTVLAQLRQHLEARGFEVPPGYRWEIGGEAAERDNAVSNLLASVSVLVVLMGVTLVLIFNSFRLAGLLAVIAMLSGGLGMVALWLTGYPFGFMAIVGTMGLMGVAMNDSIVVLAAIREHPEARAGVPAAVCDVVVRATRHVLSTTLTTVTGFTPLLIAGGAFWPPLAVAIAGGVVGATLLALALAPAAYILLMCPRCEFERRTQATRSTPSAPSDSLVPAM